MGAFIGPLGGLIELMHYQESQSVSQGEDPSFFTGLDGAKTAFIQPRTGLALREWSVSQGTAFPEQAAAFHAMCLGAQGAGPFRFVDPLAQWNNVLTPRQSLLDPVVLPSTAAPARADVVGLGSMPGARVDAASWSWIVERVPVLPGRAVTVSVWVSSLASATVRAQCLSVDGVLTTASSVAVPPSAGMWATTTVVPGPSSARVAIRVSGSSSVTAACPQVTWTDSAVPWSVGRGADQVVVSGFSESYERTGRLEGQRVIEYSAKVTEVGSGA